MPELLLPGMLYAAIPLAAVACGWAWYAFRRGNKRLCMLGLAADIALSVLFLALHVYHLSRVGFTPQTNAYGSIFFVLEWAVDVVMLIGRGLAGTALARMWQEVEHWRLYMALHVQMTAHYGYFAAAVAFVAYGTLYLSPYAI